jgi:hypothetical protein
MAANLDSLYEIPANVLRIPGLKPWTLIEGFLRLIAIIYKKKKQQTNKLHGLSPRAKPTERPPLLGEVIANFCG